MNSLLLVIASLCQSNSSSSTVLQSRTLTDTARFQIVCQQDLIKCAKGNSLNFQSDTATEARLAQCVIDGVHNPK